MPDDLQDKRSHLRSKTQLGLVFAREELKEFPAALELLEVFAERLDRLETGSFTAQEEPTKPQRRTPAYGLDMSEVLPPKAPLPKPVPPELRSASGSFKKATEELRETLLQSSKRTQEISEEEMAEILKGRKDTP